MKKTTAKKITQNKKANGVKTPKNPQGQKDKKVKALRKSMKGKTSKATLSKARKAITKRKA